MSGLERSWQAVEALADVLGGARWPDGARDGFPTRLVCEMLAQHLIAHGVILADHPATDQEVSDD